MLSPSTIIYALVALTEVTSIYSKYTIITPIEDPIKADVIKEFNIFRFSSQPSSSPSEVLSFAPSSEDSDVPTGSFVPSSSPSHSPSISYLPSSYYRYGFVPNATDDESLSFFNYNPRDKYYGPGVAIEKVFQFISVDRETNETVLKNVTYLDYEGSSWSKRSDSAEYLYWKSFETNRTLQNRCQSDPWRQQSPIDLCEDYVNAECYEHHQIRNVGGDYDLDDDEVTLKILPSKLRIEYSRVNADLKEDIERPPHSDFAHNWNGYIPVVHIDIKIPSEHTICGKRFEGEYQIFFYHSKRREPIVQSILISIHPNERPHLHFQLLLNRFQDLADARVKLCHGVTSSDSQNITGTDDTPISFLSPSWDETVLVASTQSRDRSSDTINNSTILSDEFDSCIDSNETFTVNMISYDCFSIESAMCNISDVLTRCPRQCQLCGSESNTISEFPSSAPSRKNKWSPFFPRIVNSIYFYAYQGSMTEPPCSEWVSWRVLDKPMEISTSQLIQLKDILFNQLDAKCRRSSVQWNGSVARPIQSLNERPLWKCTEKDYFSDHDKRGGK